MLQNVNPAVCPHEAIFLNRGGTANFCRLARVACRSVDVAELPILSIAHLIALFRKKHPFQGNSRESSVAGMRPNARYFAPPFRLERGGIGSQADQSGSQGRLTGLRR